MIASLTHIFSYHFCFQEISDDLRDLVPIVQFKNREKHPGYFEYSDTLSKVAGHQFKI